MVVKCKKCGARFLSKADLRDHEALEFMEDMAKANSADFLLLYKLLAALKQDIEIAVILSISRRLRCSFEDACEAYAGNWETLNNYKLKKKVEEKKHEHQ